MSEKKPFFTGELLRQLIHILTGICSILIISISGTHATSVFAVLLAAFLLLSFLLRGSKIPERAPSVLRRLGRPDKQIIKFQGTILLLSGVLVTLILFPRDIVYASVAIVTLGDSVATIAGTSFGRHELPYSEKKTFEGTLSGLVAAFLGALLFVTPLQAFIGSVGGMLMESVINLQTARRADMRGVVKFFLNDNFLIPVFASVLMVLVGG